MSVSLVNWFPAMALNVAHIEKALSATAITMLVIEVLSKLPLAKCDSKWDKYEQYYKDNGCYPWDEYGYDPTYGGGRYYGGDSDLTNSLTNDYSAHINKANEHLQNSLDYTRKTMNDIGTGVYGDAVIDFREGYVEDVKFMKEIYQAITSELGERDPVTGKEIGGNTIE